MGILFDFSRSEEVDRWQTVNDIVMGGRSQSSRVFTAPGVMVFKGQVSLEQGGGFASVRSVVRRYDLGGTEGLLITAGGDGRRYKLSVRCDPSLDAIAYQVPLDIEAGRVQTLPLPWQAFRPTHHGRLIEGYEPLDPSDIRSFGIVIGDRQEGPFRLELHRLETMGEPQ